MKEENKTFVAMVKVNGQEAIALLDSGGKVLMDTYWYADKLCDSKTRNWREET